MGRPKKNGFDYFPYDVGFYKDTKIRKLLRAKGTASLTIYSCLLCNIYETGYYLEWDDDMPFIISEQVGLDEEEVSDVLDYCMKLGLFDYTLFSENNIVTSASIQSRYEEIIRQTKRKNKIGRYNLLEEKDGVSSEETIVNSEETIINSEETVVSSGFSTQRKEKKKEKNIYSSKEEHIQKKNDFCSSGEELALDLDIPPKRAKPDYVRIVALWHEVCTSYPRVTKLTDKRKLKMDLRMKELNDDYEQLTEIFKKMQASSFMRGGNWATFDWVFESESNMTKVLEGNYDDKSKPRIQETSKSVNASWAGINFDPTRL